MTEQINRMPLGGREKEVLALAAQGFTDRQIAEKLGLSEVTVKTYWERAREKLGAKNKTHAVAIAYMMGKEPLSKGMSSLLETNAIAVALADFEGRFIEANDRFCDLLGYKRQEIPDLNWWDLSAPESTHLCELACEQMKTMGHCTPFQKEYIRKDGSRVSVILGGSLLEGDPTKCMVYVVELNSVSDTED